MKYLQLSLALICLLSSMHAADAPSALSLHLLELSGRKAGICSLPRCGDGTLAVELAKNSTLLVHAMSEQPAEVAAARKAADDGGIFGRTLYVEDGSVSKNPLADWCADLLIIDDASDSDMANIPQKELRRVLCPYRGVAVVGRAKALGAGLTRPSLEAWLKGLDVPGGKIVEDEFGLWAVATMPPLAGGDDWTHYAHGPDQNRFAKDDALKAPYLLQWTGKPYFDGKFDIAVTAGGRFFRANVTMSVGGSPPDGITARSVYNGRLLWQRKLPNDFGTFGSLIVATSDVFYLKDGNGVLCLDPETGAELKRIVVTDDPLMECRWLMLQNGVLVTVLGPKPPLEGGTFDSLLRKLPQERWGRSQGTQGTLEEKVLSGRNFEITRHWFNGYDQGTDLVAMDAATGKKLWTLATPGIDPAKCAISGDRLFFYADRSYASCVNLRTGEALWKTDAPIAKNPIGTGYSITFMITERVGALASSDVYLINSLKDGHYQAFSAQDGRILWGKGHGRLEDNPYNEEKIGKLSYPVLMAGKMITKGGAYYDPLTGKRTGESATGGSWGGCGAFCVSTHGVHPMCGTSFDLDEGAPIPISTEVKAACLSSVIAADGLLLSGHGSCPGCVEWLGYETFRSAEGIIRPEAVAADDRLFVGKFVDKPNLPATPLDWTTYRSNNSRSSYSPAIVPAAAKVRWTWTPNTPYDYKAELENGLETQSTQSVNVGDRVYFGTAAGVVRCLDRTSGKELWNYPTAGRIISAPSSWQGKLYAGSGDGRVYCLNAQDGSLIWRYRIAPIERRIMAFSHLMSAWPVNANVLVEPSTEPGTDGAVVYASCGLLGGAGGAYVCALDARTGKPRWERALNDAFAGAAPEKPLFGRRGLDLRSLNLEGKIDATATDCAPEAIYHTVLMGSEITYTFHDLKPGAAYLVRAHFVEPWENAAGKRVLDVTLNGQPGLKSFDIFAASGGRNKAIARDMAATADASGKVAVRMAGAVGSVLVSGLELLDGAQPVCRVQTGGGGVASAGFAADVGQAREEVPLFPSGAGQMAWYKGYIWLHAGDSGLIIVDAATGKMTAAIDINKIDNLKSTSRDHMRAATYAASRGQDIGILPGGWVAIGGKEIYEVSNLLNQPRNSCAFLRAEPGFTPLVNGYPDVVVLQTANSDSAIPVWDGGETLLMGKPEWRMGPTLWEKFSDLLAAELIAHPFDPKKAAYGFWNSGLRNSMDPDLPSVHPHQVLSDKLKFSGSIGPVLTGNAVVFFGGAKDTWHVMAVNRTDSTLLWDVSVPAQPVVGGLSVTSSGDVVAPLVDGRVICIGGEAK